ncbi:MAG: thymidine kinase [Nanoarchaeota archaeon]
MAKKEAKLELIVGTMFSGKSTELNRRMGRYRVNHKFQLFNHSIDERYGQDHVSSHDGFKMPATYVSSAAQLREKTDPKATVIGIDEIQFFDSDIVALCDEYVNSGKIVVAGGLLKDFRDEYFPFRDNNKNMSHLLAVADSIAIYTAICNFKEKEEEEEEKCGRKASRVQRFIEGKVAPYHSPTVLVGGKEDYAPRCRQHYQFYKI